MCTCGRCRCTRCSALPSCSGTVRLYAEPFILYTMVHRTLCLIRMQTPYTSQHNDSFCRTMSKAQSDFEQQHAHCKQQYQVPHPLLEHQGQTGASKCAMHSRNCCRCCIVERCKDPHRQSTVQFAAPLVALKKQVARAAIRGMPTSCSRWWRNSNKRSSTALRNSLY